MRRIRNSLAGGICNLKSLITLLWRSTYILAHPVQTKTFLESLNIQPYVRGLVKFKPIYVMSRSFYPILIVLPRCILHQGGGTQKQANRLRRVIQVGVPIEKMAFAGEQGTQHRPTGHAAPNGGPDTWRTARTWTTTSLLAFRKRGRELDSVGTAIFSKNPLFLLFCTPRFLTRREGLMLGRIWRQNSNLWIQDIARR